MRRRMKKSRSKRVFTRGTKVLRKNWNTQGQRGGIRL
jgi:hypothetical protein